MNSMDTGWRERLDEVVKKDGRPHSVLSAEMGRSRTYVGQILKDGKTPTVENLIQLCAVLKVDVSYILAGVSLTYKGQKLYDKYDKLSEFDQGLVDDLLTRLSIDRSNNGRGR